MSLARLAYSTGLVLREVEEYARTTTEIPRPYARVVMSDMAVVRKIEDANLRLLTNLEQRNVVELHHIQHERFTGGEYRRAQVEKADAMLGIAGGKGTFSAGTYMTELGKPVLPLDLRLGSISDDGEGAVALHREMMSDPCRFFSNTDRDVINRIGLTSLDKGINDSKAVARVAAEMFEREFDAAPKTTLGSRTGKQFTNVWNFTKALPVVSAAIKIIEWVVRAVG